MTTWPNAAPEELEGTEREIYCACWDHVEDKEQKVIMDEAAKRWDK